MVANAPALATRQCPPEFGEKSAAFMAVGWGVLLLAVLLGVWLMALVARRSRGWRWPWRLPALLLGTVMMFGVWIGGLAVFFQKFALAC